MQESNDLHTADCMDPLSDCDISQNLSREHNYYSDSFKLTHLFPNTLIGKTGRLASYEADRFISDMSLIPEFISDDQGIESFLSTTSTDTKASLANQFYQLADDNSFSRSIDTSKMSSSFDKNHFVVSSPDSAFSEGSLNDFDSEDNSRIETLINQLMNNSEDVQSDISNYLQSEIPSSEEIASFDLDNFFNTELINDNLFSGDPNTPICTSTCQKTPNPFENKLKPLFDDFASSSKNIVESSDNQGSISKTSSTFNHDQPLFGSQSEEMFETGYFDGTDYPISMFTEGQKSPESTLCPATSFITNTSSSYILSYKKKYQKQTDCFQKSENIFSNEQTHNSSKAFVKHGSKTNGLSKKLQGYLNDKHTREGHSTTRVHLLSQSNPSIIFQNNSDNNQAKTSKSSKKKEVFATPEAPSVLSKTSCLRKVLPSHLSHPSSPTSSLSFAQSPSPGTPHQRSGNQYLHYIHSLKEKQTDIQLQFSDSKRHPFKTPFPNHVSHSEKGSVSELEKYLRGIIPTNGDCANVTYLTNSSTKLNNIKKKKSSFLYKLLTGEISQELYREIDYKLRETERASIIS